MNLIKTNEMIDMLKQDETFRAKRIWKGLTVYYKDGKLLNAEDDLEVIVGLDDNWAVYRNRTQTDFMTAFNAWQENDVYIEVYSRNGYLLKIYTPKDKSMMIPNTFIKNGIWYILEV
jgi:hypothetical protein